MAAFPVGEIPSISVELLTEFRSREVQFRWKNNPLLYRYPQMRIPWRTAMTGLRVARFGTQLALESGLMLLDGVNIYTHFFSINFDILH